MLNLLLTGAVSFVITFMAIPAIIRVAEEKKLFDLPDARKLHNRSIASLGGVGVFLGFFISILISVSFQQNPELQYFFASAIVIFFLGLKDDILIISASKKFLGQLAATAILVHLAEVRIDSMHGFLGIDELPGMISLLLSYATIIVVINAFNLIDGVDGLAGSLGVLTTAAFGAYFFMAEMPGYALLAFSLTASLIAFLIFNYQPAKIFMGDSGSLLLGLVNAVLVIKFITVADAKAGQFPITASVAVGFSILVVPLLDTLRVFSIRIFNGRSPFAPDRNHIHHLLLDKGLTHRGVTLSCVGLNAVFMLAAFLAKPLGSTIVLSFIIAAWFGLVGILFSLPQARPKLMVSKPFDSNANPALPKVSKIVPLSKEAAVAEQ